MRRRRIEVIIQFLNVLAVIAFAACEAEEALLYDRIVAIPKRQRKADSLVTVADAGDAVLVPTIGARAGMIVRKIVPRRAVRRVILADSSPGTFAQIWPPAFPVFRPRVRFGKALFFCFHNRY